MDIVTLNDLSALIDLCRKKNIEKVVIGKETIELKFVEDAVAPKTRRARSSKDEPIIEDKGYSDEELLMWSSAGLPDVEVKS